MARDFSAALDGQLAPSRQLTAATAEWRRPARRSETKIVDSFRKMQSRFRGRRRQIGCSAACGGLTNMFVEARRLTPDAAVATLLAGFGPETPSRPALETVREEAHEFES
jgi:hypothetical protein